MLKAQFILVYISCLLCDWVKVTKSNINIDHCTMYYDMGIHKHQFSSESLWKCAEEKNHLSKRYHLCILMKPKLETLLAKRN